MSVNLSDTRIFVTKGPIPRSSDTTQEGFERAEWVEINKIFEVPDHGTTATYVNQDLVDQPVSDKQKSTEDPGSGSLTVVPTPGRPGFDALMAHAQTSMTYGTAIVYNDAESVGATPTVHYNKTIISGPSIAGGGRGVFANNVFGFQNTGQRQVTVFSRPGVAPTVITAPSITSTSAKVGVELSLDIGVHQSVVPGVVYTYQWKNGVNDIAGATQETYTPVAGDVGGQISCVVTAANGYGEVSTETSSTTAVVA